ncbi:MAG: hypothetical protein ACRYGA_02700 [Janthinobacterium lividum]
MLLFQNFSQRTHDGRLGFGAGVMFAATSFSLVIPALGVACAASVVEGSKPLRWACRPA